MKLNLQKVNPFKRQDQKRDTDGKFTAGGGGLKAIKKFNWGRAAPVIAVVGLVGGYVVYQSFAGTALYRYQYSAYQCPSFNKDDTAKNATESCVTNSAEGMVYRMYQGAYGRTPDQNGLRFWTQKLAGDRDKPSEVAQAMLNEKSEASGLSNQDFIAKLYTVSLNRTADPGGLAYWTGKLDGGTWTRERVMSHFANTSKVNYNVINLKMTASDNQTFVEQLYSGMFNRQGDSGGVKYWTDQINLKKQGRNNALAYFAISSEALRAHGAGFASYLKDAPKVDVVPTAQKIRDERLWKAALNANAAKKAIDPVAERVDKAKGNRDLARTIASKSKPTLSDLSQIASQERTARAYLTRSNSTPSTTGKYLDQNRVWYVKSVDVAKWSPDLTADEIKKEYDKTVLYHEFAKSSRTELSNIVKDIASSYKSAEKKYEAEELRKAEQAARDAKNGSGGIGDIVGDIDIDVEKSTAEQIAECNSTPPGVNAGIVLRYGTRDDYVEPGWRGGRCVWVIVGRNYHCINGYSGSGMACVPTYKTPNNASCDEDHAYALESASFGSFRTYSARMYTCRQKRATRLWETKLNLDCGGRYRAVTAPSTFGYKVCKLQ